MIRNFPQNLIPTSFLSRPYPDKITCRSANYLLSNVNRRAKVIEHTLEMRSSKFGIFFLLCKEFGSFTKQSLLPLVRPHPHKNIYTYLSITFGVIATTQPNRQTNVAQNITPMVEVIIPRDALTPTQLRSITWPLQYFERF